MRIRLLYVTAISLCITLVAVSPALAHTKVSEMDPEEGASLQRAPDQVHLTFGGPVEAEFSPLEVYNEREERVDLDNARLGQDKTSLKLGLREGLGGGNYTVEYRYTGVDGHPIEGSYAFSVSGEPEPVSQEVSEEAKGAGKGGDTERNGGMPVALYGLVGLGSLAAVGAIALRRR